MNFFEFNINLPEISKNALNILESEGFEAWIVGGFIRNQIINSNENFTKNSDIDITTNATPSQVEALFQKNNWTTYSIGKKFGTIGIYKKGLIKPIEITTYRAENNYKDGRHPGTISFSDTIEKDLSRRDFTCNSLAYNPKCGILDLYNGIKDIKNKTIKCVGEPKLRFTEDRLRILRAIRFSSQLGFKIENKSDKAIRDMKCEINLLSHERVRDELTKLICGHYAKDTLQNYKDVVFSVIPELKPLDGFNQKTKYHNYDIYTHTLMVVDKMPSSLIGRWAALLHDIGKPECFTIDKQGNGHFYNHPKKSEEIAKQILERLKFSTKTKREIMLLIRWHDEPVKAEKKDVKRLLCNLSKSNIDTDIKKFFKTYCHLRRADSLAHSPKYQENFKLTNQIENIFDEIYANKEAYCIKDLAINGTDIIKLGIEPGPQILKILNACLDLVIDEKIKNNKTDLTDIVKLIISNSKNAN